MRVQQTDVKNCFKKFTLIYFTEFLPQQQPRE